MSDNLVFYDSSDTTANPELTFTGLQNGTPSAAQTLHLWNDKDLVLNADDANEILIDALSDDSGGSDPSMEHAVAANRYVEVRLVGQSGAGIQAQTTPWTAVGKTAALLARTIPADCYRTVEVRLNIPAGVGIVAAKVWIRARSGGVSEALGDGHYEGASGILAGLGDAGFSYILEGGAVVPAGTPDNTVDIETTIGVLEGQPFNLVASNQAFSNLDGSSAALASGESYWATVSVGSDGAGGFEYHFTKSDKAAAPLDEATRPEVPDDEIFVAYIEVPFAAVIDTTEIDQSAFRKGGFDADYDAATNVVSIHGGRAACGNHFIRREAKTDLTLALSDDTWVWLQPGGGYSQTLTDEAPVDRALALWKFTCDGSGVTAAVDLRTWTAPNLRELYFSQRGTLAANDYTYLALPTGGPWYILPVSGVVMGLGDEGAVSGSTVSDIEWLSAPATPTWTTLFPSSGSVDLRPTLAHDAGLGVTAGGRPETLRLPGGALIRWKVVSVPGTASSDLSGLLRAAQPGS